MIQPRTRLHEATGKWGRSTLVRCRNVRSSLTVTGSHTAARGALTQTDGSDLRDNIEQKET